MRRTYWLIGFLILLVLGGMVVAQSTTDEATEEPDITYFEVAAELGRALPRKIIYDPNFERYLIVDVYGKLFLSNALTFETEHVLYELGEYNDIAFSHDGTLAAVALQSRIELWDTATGTMVGRLTELGQPRQVVGPITFSRDDQYLIFQGVYPAPRAIRVAENQTINIPWIWHIPSAFGTNTSQFPGDAEAWQFFDYYNGMVIAPNNRLIAALPSRLQVLDIATLDLLFEIPTERYERDPMNVWFSSRDNQIYVRPVNQNSLVQVDTERGVLVEIPLERALTASDLELIGSIELSEQARVIGEARSTNDLKRLFLPYDRDTILRTYGAGALSIALIDLVVPPISEGDNIQALIFIYNEDTQTGFFRLTSGSAQQMLLSPDGNELITRLPAGALQARADETITTFSLDTGMIVRQFVPALRGIGAYQRAIRNRVLAFNAAGDVLVSDFQRINPITTAVLAEDLRYSRSFDRFFFSADSQNIVTLSGSEWRLWDVNSGQVVRREAVQFNGSIIATSSDGFRYLSSRQLNDGTIGREIIDLNDNTIVREEIFFNNLPGHSIENVFHSPDWRRYLIIYTVNPYGDYYPGNQIAMYEMGVGLRWLIAGDDLPPNENRIYGWVDNDRVYIQGSGFVDSQPARIFGVEYDESRLPQCVVEQFPQQLDVWMQLWERQLYHQRPDKLHLLAQLICTSEVNSTDDMTRLLLPTPTPGGTIPTAPASVGGVPYCLLLRYPDQADAYTQVWRETVADLTTEQIAEAEQLLCEGIGVIPTPAPEFVEAAQSPYLDQTMIIDAVSGVRSSGAFQPIEVIRRPIEPVAREFERIYKRSLGQAILSPDAALVASSSLPGELVIYRIVIGYETIMAHVTETAVAIQQAQNLVYPLPSHTPMFNPIGTARPTLTPTVTPTLLPRPQEVLAQPQAGEIQDMCPSERLYSTDNLPQGYNPPGAIITTVQDNVLWRVHPITGQRAPDDVVPQCTEGIECSFSPDRTWILAFTFYENELYVIRPDGSDYRLLAGEDDPKPRLTWAGPNILEENINLYLEDEGRYVNAIRRDILGVFPDPDPILLEATINELPVEIINRQPGGSWVVARIPFRTGASIIYQYYLYNLATAESILFARYPSLNMVWHPLGDRLFFQYDNFHDSEWYQLTMETLEFRRMPSRLYPGTWSPNGRYSVFANPEASSQRAFPIIVWDTESGLQQRYCVPETGARLYTGGFMWSPDNRYVALLAPLPKDEAQEGVGQHLLILDIETGAMVDLTNGTGFPVSWIQESYE
jgi:WD40 repeat protein